MRQQFIIIVLSFLISQLFAQKGSCDIYPLKADSIYLTNTTVKELVEVSSLLTKNNYKVQFVKQGKKNHLIITLKYSIEGDKQGSLYVFSNKKQYFLKQATLKRMDKDYACFIIDLNSNYVATIRDNGLTSLYFNDSMTFEMPKTDSELIKKQADCFYTIITKK